MYFLCVKVLVVGYCRPTKIIPKNVEEVEEVLLYVISLKVAVTLYRREKETRNFIWNPNILHTNIKPFR